LSFPALVLAAGASRRMGAVKALLEVDGEPLLTRCVRLLSDAGADPVVVVLGHHADQLRGPAEAAGAACVRNPDQEGDQLSSLRVGLAALPDDAAGVMVLPVDHGLVREATILLVMEAARADPTRPAVPSVEMRRGHPTWFPAGLFGELEDPTLVGGARAVLRRRGDDIRHLVVDDPGAVRDLDTPGDWAASEGWRA
jgi:CTP:molybdopterin cytidylyltransferase MocA